MPRRLITYSYPQDDHQVKVFRTIIEQDDLSPYETVEYLRNNIELLENSQIEQINDKIDLREVLTIHNRTGMRDISQTDTMIAKVRRGEQVINSDGLPNIKIALAPNGKYLLFDGHHTALAYLIAGKNYLHEAPHLLISNQNQPLSAEEIAYFFPEDKRQVIADDWLKYTINWQNPTAKIELREIQTIGELFELIS